MTDVIMPQMGESIAEGTVTKWLKKIGDSVKRDEPLFEISTDKVDAEIPAPVAGVLSEILVQPGTTVVVGAVVGRMSAVGTIAIPVPAPPPPALPVVTAPPPPSAPSPVAVAPPPAPPAPPPSAPPASDTLTSTDYTPERPREGMTTGELRMARSSPVVRKIALEYGVEINDVPGTGLGGRVTREDILSYVESRKGAVIRRDMPSPAPTYASPAPVPVPVPQTAPAQLVAPAPTPTPPIAAPPAPGAIAAPAVAVASPAPTEPAPKPAPVAAAASTPPAAPPSPPIPKIPSMPAPPAPTLSSATVAFTAPKPSSTGDTPAVKSAASRVEIVPMSPIRKKTSEHMVMSKRTSAHVSTVWEVDMTRVAMLRDKYKKTYLERSNVRLTYTPFIVKVATDAIKAFPILNARVDGDSIVYHKDINVGMAVALDWGLIVPVITAADEKNVLGLARVISDLGERARTKKMKVDEIQGGTFTITNPGSFGSLFGTPIINQPQVAILGVGTIEKRPVIREDAIAIRTMAYFCLTFDHRIIDGSEADKFMAHFKHGMQNFDESAL